MDDSKTMNPPTGIIAIPILLWLGLAISLLGLIPDVLNSLLPIGHRLIGLFLVVAMTTIIGGLGLFLTPKIYEDSLKPLTFELRGCEAVPLE